MKKVNFPFVVLIVSILFFLFSILNTSSFLNAFSDVNALTDEEGDRIVCRCQDGFLTNNRCRVTNDNDICATSSQPYENIQCQDYNSNCK